MIQIGDSKEPRELPWIHFFLDINIDVRNFENIAPTSIEYLANAIRLRV